MTLPDQSDSRPVYGPPTAEEWLRSLRNIRLTPAGRRAVELYRSGMPDDEVRAQVAREFPKE